MKMKNHHTIDNDSPATRWVFRDKSVVHFLGCVRLNVLFHTLYNYLVSSSLAVIKWQTNRSEDTKQQRMSLCESNVTYITLPEV